MSQTVCSKCVQQLSMKERREGKFLCRNCETMWKKNADPVLVAAMEQLVRTVSAIENDLAMMRPEWQ